MPSNKPWLRLADIAENARKVLQYTHGMTFDDFISNPLVIDGSERCLLRISEAAVKLGPFAEELLPAHDWKSIRGIGNILRHDYNRVSLPMIWDTITRHLEPLLNEAEAAILAHEQTET